MKFVAIAHVLSKISSYFQFIKLLSVVLFTRLWFCQFHFEMRWHHNLDEADKKLLFNWEEYVNKRGCVNWVISQGCLGAYKCERTNSGTNFRQFRAIYTYKFFYSYPLVKEYTVLWVTHVSPVNSDVAHSPLLLWLASWIFYGVEKANGIKDMCRSCG